MAAGLMRRVFQRGCWAFPRCCRLLAVATVAAGVAAAQALTLGELKKVFPRHRVVEEETLVFASGGVRYVALANRKKEVGIILLLPMRSANAQKIEQLAEQFRQLIPAGAEDFRIEALNYKGKSGQALIHTSLLSLTRTRRNRWMGVSLFDCLAYGIGKAQGRIAAVSEDSITLEVPHELYGRMRVTVYLLSLGEVQIVDVVAKRRSRKNYENAEELSREFDFYYRDAVNEDDVRDLKRDYMISRPLVCGRFQSGDYYSALLSYVSVEGGAFRIGTARAFRELRVRRNLDPLAYSGEESPMPEQWPAPDRAKPQPPAAAAAGESRGRGGKTVPEPGQGARRQAPQAGKSPQDEPQPSSAKTMIGVDPGKALEVYMEALRHL